MFGVRRKGTTSFEVYMGSGWGAAEGANAVYLGEYKID
jgi:hypothetical protein